MSDLVVCSKEELAALIEAAVAKAMKTRAPAAELPPVLTSEQAAAYLQMPVGVLRRRTQRNEVPSFKIGAVLRYRRAELDEWIANGGKMPDERKAG